MSGTLSQAPVSSVEQMHRLVQRLAESVDALGDQRRSDPRVTLHAPLSLGVRLGQEQAFRTVYRAWATDLSANGLGGLTETALDTGLEMWAAFEPMPEVRLLLPVRIVYTRRMLPSTYRVGAAFLFERCV